MAWRVAASVLTLRKQLQAYAPRAVPPATPISAWGTIGDVFHDPTSDHAPKDFPGWGNDIVTAGDFPNRPDLGLNIYQVFESIRLSRDRRVKYMISNDRICSSYATKVRKAWEWGPYNPNDPNRDRHYDHGHMSVVGDARADGTQPWQITKEDEDDMGASTGPITLQMDVTSLNIVPVNAGTADPRSAWLNFCNETLGEKYALRVWYTKGDEVWHPLPGTDNGMLALNSGQRFSQALPDGTACLSVSRKALDGEGNVVEPAEKFRPYGGHLTCVVERGAVRR